VVRPLREGPLYEIRRLEMPCGRLSPIGLDALGVFDAHWHASPAKSRSRKLVLNREI